MRPFLLFVVVLCQLSSPIASATSRAPKRDGKRGCARKLEDRAKYASAALIARLDALQDKEEYGNGGASIEDYDPQTLTSEKAEAYALSEISDWGKGRVTFKTSSGREKIAAMADEWSLRAGGGEEGDVPFWRWLSTDEAKKVVQEVAFATTDEVPEHWYSDPNQIDVYVRTGATTGKIFRLSYEFGD
jgi:hypothetical protein